MEEGEKIAKLLILHGYEVRGSDVAMVCPFCGHKKFFLNITKGLYCCKRSSCEANDGGNYFTMVNHFYQGENRYKEAAHDIGCNEYRIDRKIKRMPQEEKKEAPLELRAEVYKFLAEHPVLTPAIRDELHRRGLNNEQIRKWGFTSLPITYKDRKIFGMAIKNAGIDAAGCPGFKKDNNNYIIADFGFDNRMKSFGKENEEWFKYWAYLIPSYDLHGNIQFFQIGWDRRLVGEVGKYKYAKYTSFSNPKDITGGKAKSRCGYIGSYKVLEDGAKVPDLKGQTKLPIIEGTLKSILYYEFSGCREAVISQVGVSNMRSVEEFLLQLKQICPDVDTIIDCYDMDKITVEDAQNGSIQLKKHIREFGKEKFLALMNKDVQKASEKLRNTVIKCGYKYEKRLWAPQYKGIDDLLYAKVIKK